MKGIVPVVITPLNKGEIDINSLINLLEYLSHKGARSFWMFGTGGEDWAINAQERIKIIKSIKKQKDFDSLKFIYGVGNMRFKETIALVKALNSLKISDIHFIQPSRVLSPECIINQYKQIKLISNLRLWGYFSDNYSRSFDEKEWNLNELKTLLAGIKLSTSNISNLKKVIEKTSSDFILPAKANQFFKSLNCGASSTTSIEANVSFCHLDNIFNLFKNNYISEAFSAQDIFSKRASLIRTKYGRFNFMNIAEIKYILFKHKIISNEEVSNELFSLSNECKSLLSNIKID